MTALVSPKATDSLETWLSYLEKSHSKPIDMGLTRIQAVARELNLLQPARYVITVAGTNGKGSTCKFLETALLLAGLRVGVYSSPHLIHYNERVRIQGKMVDSQALVASFTRIEQQKSQSLSYFEFGTLAALDLFRQAELDVAILEVGLGGRLDATNIIDADLAVITSIDIDHVEFLGDNREAIGYEKAGICRENTPLVIGEPDCPQSILTYAAQLHCPVSQRDVDWQFSLENDRFQWQSEKKSFVLPTPNIPTMNAATAIAALLQTPFQISDDILQKTAEMVEMTGRFQRVSPQVLQYVAGNRPLADVIIDVGHNPHAARYLASRLQVMKTDYQHIYAVFSVLADKDLLGIVSPLAEIIDRWYCAGLAGYRGQSGVDVLAKLQQVLPHAQGQAFESVAQASHHAFLQANDRDLILVFGSFYTVADFLTDITK